MVTFNELARERNRERVQAEAFSYTEMLREALAGALLYPAEDTDPAEAARTSLAQFNEAMQQAVASWSAGKLTLSPTTTVTKCRSMLNCIDAELAKAGVKPTKRGATKLPSTQVKYANKAEVLEEANRLAREKMAENPKLTLGAARAQVWKENPELVRQYRELPDGPKKATPTKPVRKGSGVVARVNAEAQEIRKREPSLTPAQARSRVWQLNPDLREQYERALRS